MEWLGDTHWYDVTLQLADKSLSVTIQIKAIEL